MTQFDVITETALGNFGLVTAAQAKELGIRSKDIAEWVRLGRMERRGWGVYRIAHYAPSEFDRYAEAVAIVGKGAVVFGDSVLAMLNLALVNPLRVSVATGRRVRHRLPEWIRLVKLPKGEETGNLAGVPCQSLAGAIRACRGRVMAERLAEAVREAGRKGWLGADEAEALEREVAP